MKSEAILRFLTPFGSYSSATRLSSSCETLFVMDAHGLRYLRDDVGYACTAT